MADQKRWFKVWTSVVSDDDFDTTRAGGLVSLGRFSMLGAYTALHGEKGVLEIMPDTLLKLTQAGTLDELKSDLAFKNVVFSEGQNRHGKISVTWQKWRKYQEDHTAKERQASRRKRREEKIREDERRKDENNRKNHRNDSFFPEPESDSGIKAFPDEWKWLEELIRKVQLPGNFPRERFLDFAWWDAVSYRCGGLSFEFLEREFAGIRRWLMDNPNREPTPKGYRRFLATWLERSYEHERRQPSAQGTRQGFAGRRH